MNMCFLEVAMSEKCRSSHFQSEGGVKSLRTGGGLKILGRGGGEVLLPGGGGRYPITWHECDQLIFHDNSDFVTRYILIRSLPF